MKILKFLGVWLAPTLLIPYLTLCFVRPPQIADSIIVFALVTLFGFKLYLKSREIKVPELSKAEKEYNEKIMELQLREKLILLEQNVARMTTRAEKGSKNDSVFRF